MRFILLVLFASVSHADEKIEKITSNIIAIPQEENTIEIPKHIPNLNWDSKGIQLVRSLDGKNKLTVLLKGNLVKHKMESFTYQVDGYEAQKIKMNKNSFDLKIPLDKSPAVIRLWLEVLVGKEVRIYSDVLNIRSEIVPSGAGADKQISY